MTELLPMTYSSKLFLKIGHDISCKIFLQRNIGYRYLCLRIYSGLQLKYGEVGLIEFKLKKKKKFYGTNTKQNVDENLNTF